MIRPLTFLYVPVKLNRSYTIRTQVLLNALWKSRRRKTRFFTVLGDGDGDSIYFASAAVEIGAAYRTPSSGVAVLVLFTARLAENMTTEQDLSIQLTFGRKRSHREGFHTDGTLRGDNLIVGIGVAALIYSLFDSWPEGFRERFGRRHVEKGYLPAR